MRILILALGSQGDVVPYVALGKGLRQAGHQVRLATFENFREMVKEHGLEFHPIRGDAQSILRGDAGLALAESGRNVLRAMRAIMKSFGTLAQSYAQDMSRDTLWETDAIINQLPASLFGYDLAEKLGVPYFSAAVIPLVRTRTFPLPFFPSQLSKIPWYNLATYRLAEQMAWQPFQRAVNRWREEVLGLPRAPFWGHFRHMHEQSLPVLNGFSAHVVPRPPDWGDHVYITGYWFLDHGDWQPPAELVDFLEASPPPVYIGFGSMPVRNPQRLTQLLLEALKKSGQRGVLLSGWAGLGSQELSQEVFTIDYAPYNWLFPRLGGVVHHGGSGTTAAALRAGVPSLVVPFLGDQFYWGQRVKELGVGPPPLPRKHLSAERLAAAISAMTSDREMQRRAAALGDRIRAENGVANAVEAFHRHVSERTQ